MKKEKITIIVEAKKDYHDGELIKHMILNRKPKTHEKSKKNERKIAKEDLKNIKSEKDAE